MILKNSVIPMIFFNGLNDAVNEYYDDDNVVFWWNPLVSITLSGAAAITQRTGTTTNQQRTRNT